MTVKNDSRNRIDRHDSLFWRFDDWLESKLYQYVPKQLADILSMKRRQSNPTPAPTTFQEWLPHIAAFAFVFVIAAVLVTIAFP